MNALSPTQAGDSDFAGGEEGEGSTLASSWKITGANQGAEHP